MAMYLHSTCMRPIALPDPPGLLETNAIQVNYVQLSLTPFDTQDDGVSFSSQGLITLGPNGAFNSDRDLDTHGLLKAYHVG